MRTILCASLLATAAPVLAQDRQIEFDLGVGVQAAPGYFGSSDVEASPTGSFSLDQLSIGGFQMGGGDPNGFGFKGGFRYIGERTSSNYAELTGLTDVDAALELGGGVTYTIEPDRLAGPFGYYAFAEVRYGVVGHESVVAEVGADLVYRPSSDWEFRVGPRLFAGDDTYAATYFGVTATEAAASAFTAFEASGGVLSSGVEIAARYALNENWGVTGNLSFEKFRNDAALSPIVSAGSDEQLTLGLLVTRTVSFDF